MNKSNNIKRIVLLSALIITGSSSLQACPTGSAGYVNIKNTTNSDITIEIRRNEGHHRQLVLERTVKLTPNQTQSLCWKQTMKDSKHKTRNLDMSELTVYETNQSEEKAVCPVYIKRYAAGLHGKIDMCRMTTRAKPYLSQSDDGRKGKAIVTFL